MKQILRVAYALFLMALLCFPSVATAPPQGGQQPLTPSAAAGMFQLKKGLRHIAMRPFGHQSGIADVADRTFVSRHTLMESVDNLVLYYSNFQVNTAGGETFGGPLTLTVKISIYDGTQFTGPITVTWNGGNPSITLGPKQVAHTDPIPLGYLPAYSSLSQIRVNTRVQCVLGTNVPVGTNANGGWYAEGDTTGIDKLDTAWLGNPTFGPSAVCTLAEGLPWQGVAILGNSIEAGTGRTTGKGTPHGWAADRLETLGIGYVYAPKSGEKISEWMGTTARRSGRLRIASLCPVIIIGYVVNDVTANRTAAEIKADLLAGWAELSRGGRHKVYQATCVPNTTSTDGWVTVANQTNAFTAGQETVKQTINAWLRDAGPTGAMRQSAGALTGILDIGAAVTVDNAGNFSLTGTKWAAGYAFNEVHPNNTGHAAMGLTITTALANYWKSGPVPNYSGYSAMVGRDDPAIPFLNLTRRELVALVSRVPRETKRRAALR